MFCRLKKGEEDCSNIWKKIKMATNFENGHHGA